VEWPRGCQRNRFPNIDFSVCEQPTVSRGSEARCSQNHQQYKVDWKTRLRRGSYFDLPEFNIKIKKDPVLLKVGMDIYSWGVTDVVNPVDLVNTRNYFDPIHSKKMGAASVSLNYSESWFEADLVYIPDARPSQLPGENSRWLPRQIYLSQNQISSVELLIPDQFNYSYLSRRNLGNPILSNFAGRLQAHLESMELALYGYDGIAAMPAIQPFVTGNAVAAGPPQVIRVNSNVQLQLMDYRQQTAGASATKTFGSWQLKGEAAWTQSSQEAAAYEGWSLATVLALEKSWNVSSEASLTTVLQYSSARRQALSGNDLSSFTDFFNSNWMLGGHFTWRDKDAVTFFYSYDVLTLSWLADLSYERSLSDAWKISCGGTSIDGPSSSPLGAYANNKNFFADLGFSF
jgi:hypothetical protein